MSVDKTKAAVRARDGFRCTACGMTAAEHRQRYGRTLDVHRTTPGSVYTVEGCVTLCRRCHGPQPRRAYGTVAPGRVISLTPSRPVYGAMEEYRSQFEFRPDKSAVIERALRLFFRSKGIDIPADEEG